MPDMCSQVKGLFVRIVLICVIAFVLTILPIIPQITPHADASQSSQDSVGVGEGPIAVSIDSVSNRTYVANYDSPSVTIIDSNNHDVISELEVGSAPTSLANLDDLGLVYVAHTGDQGSVVSIINGSDNKIIKSILIGSHGIGLASDPESKKVYVGYWNYSFGSLFVIDGLTNDVVDTFQISNASEIVAVNPKTDLIYMPNGGKGPTFVIEASSGSIVDYIATPEDNDAGGLVAVNPSTNTIYLVKHNSGYPEDGVTPSGTLYVIDGNTNTIVRNTILISPQGIAVDESRNRVYVTNSWNASLYVIDGSEGSVLGELPVERSPWGVAVDITEGTVIVANSGSDSISIMAGIATIPEFPHALLSVSAGIAVIVVFLRINRQA
jgi:YVTN family beta-propeller protein